MQNILINMCEKFHYDRLRNDRALGNRKSDNTNNPKNKNNVGNAWGPVWRSQKSSSDLLRGVLFDSIQEQLNTKTKWQRNSGWQNCMLKTDRSKDVSSKKKNMIEVEQIARTCSREKQHELTVVRPLRLRFRTHRLTHLWRCFRVSCSNSSLLINHHLRLLA